MLLIVFPLHAGFEGVLVKCFGFSSTAGELPKKDFFFLDKDSLLTEPEEAQEELLMSVSVESSGDCRLRSRDLFTSGDFGSDRFLLAVPLASGQVHSSTSHSVTE